jgi:hypothetical protein
MHVQTNLDFAIFGGMNLNKAMRAARHLGCSIFDIRRSGEVRFTHPLMDRPCRVNARRHSAPRHLVAWLRSLAALAPGPL